VVRYCTCILTVVIMSSSAEPVGMPACVRAAWVRAGRRWKPQHWIERRRAPLGLIRFTCSCRSRLPCLCRSRQRRAAPQTEVDLMQEWYQTIRGQSASVVVACCFNTCPTFSPAISVAPASCRDPESEGMHIEPRRSWIEQARSLRAA
jgi:hypothetical protein